jgi:UDP-glucose 4-epimerase
MTTALVTGGAGFIGSNLVQLLLSHGWQVRVLDNLSTGYAKNLEGLPVSLLKGDVRRYEDVSGAVKGVDVIFHLAASIGNVKSLNNPQEDSEINVIGALNVLEAARKHGIPRIVYSSSAAIFGELVTMPIAEDHPQNPDSPYGVSKLAAEKHMLCYARLFGLTVVCLRYFNVYGVNQRYDAYGNVIPIFSQRLFEKQSVTIYGDGEQTRDFVNVKDVAQANYLAATKATKTDVFNVGSGRDITINSLVDAVQKASGVKAISVIHAPSRPAEVRHCLADISKARRLLGFEPSPDIETGLEEYYRWFSAEWLSSQVR